MKITSQLQSSDYKAFRRFAFFRYRKSHLYYLFLWGSLTISFAFNALRESGETESILNIVITLFAAGFIASLYLGVVIAILLGINRLLPNRVRDIYGFHTWELLEDRFKEENEAGISETKYESIRIMEGRNHYYLIRKNGITSIIPKRAELSGQEFFMALKEKIDRTHKF